MDYTTNVNNFCEEIRDRIGGEPGPLQIDGEIHRFDIDKRGDKVGWYVGHSNGDIIAGAFGSHKEAGKHTWNSGGGSNGNATRTATDQAKIKAMFENLEKKREEVKKTAKRRANWIWKNATDAAEDHPYLIKKGIKAHDARQYKGAFVVPVMADREITSIQFISADGSKRFLKGGSVAGGSWIIPGDENQILCEGYATAASIHEATGATVKISFNASNILKVAEPGWTIAGDNDAFTKTKHGEPWNPGREKALTAAWEHNCLLAIPTFPDTGTEPTDFNDLHSVSGLDVVREQIGDAVLPQDYLLEELKTDAGACYRPENTKGLKMLKERNKAAYMTLRKKLKKLQIGITELEQDMKQIRGDGIQGPPDHLTLAKEIVMKYGKENLIFSDSFIWKWDVIQGVWKTVDPREIKQAINAKVEKALSDPTKGAVDSIFDLLKTEIFRPNHKWDAEHERINVLNGELFWTGEEWVLEPHCREHYRTTQLPVKYDQDAIPERFEKFLREITRGDKDAKEKRFLILELFGYSLLTTARYEKFVILIGSGANGKSVLLDLLINFVGPENAAAVQPSKFDSPFQRAYLSGKLVNAVSELAVGEEIKDDKMKAISSGELVTCEHKFKDPFDLKPFCTIWLATNHLPHTRDFSPALFRRALIITFNWVFQEHEQDKTLKEKLTAELPGILNLALAAIGGVFRRGYFTEPDSCKEAKKEWRLHADQAAEFVQDRCVMGPGLSISSARIFAEYSEWAKACGIRRTLGRNTLTTRLCNLGAERSVSSDGSMRMLAGIDLKGY